MTRVPSPNPKYVDIETSARRARGTELLDMIRQNTYAGVMRRANLKRHLEACPKCRPERTCTKARELAGLVAAAHNAVVDCREQLAELDAQRAAAEARERVPVAVSGTLEMF